MYWKWWLQFVLCNVTEWNMVWSLTSRYQVKLKLQNVVHFIVSHMKLTLKTLISNGFGFHMNYSFEGYRIHYLNCSLGRDEYLLWTITSSTSICFQAQDYVYPGCQRFVLHDFRSRSSLLWPAQHSMPSANIGRPSAYKSQGRPRQTCGTQGRLCIECNRLIHGSIQCH